MTPQLQQLLAGIIVLAAAAYLGWRWRSRRTTAVCDGCQSGARPAARRGVRSPSLVVLRDP